MLYLYEGAVLYGYRPHGEPGLRTLDSDKSVLGKDIIGEVPCRGVEVLTVDMQ